MTIGYACKAGRSTSPRCVIAHGYEELHSQPNFGVDHMDEMITPGDLRRHPQLAQLRLRQYAQLGFGANQHRIGTRPVS